MRNHSCPSVRGGLFWMALLVCYNCLGQPSAPSINKIKARHLPIPAKRIDVRIVGSTGMGFGSGQMVYGKKEPHPRYLNRNRYEYTVQINSSLRLGLGGLFEYKGVQLGLFGGFESYQHGRAILREKIRWHTYQFSSNTGVWPTDILYYGGKLGYAIDLGRIFRIVPNIGAWLFSYVGASPFEEGNSRNINDHFTDRYQYGGGVELGAKLNSKSNLGVNITRMITQFDASNYFVDIDPNTFEHSFRQTFIEFSYSHSLYSR